LYEQHAWEQDMLERFAVEVKKDALVNRAVSEAETGSPTRGARPATHAIKKDNGFVINGVKTFTSMSRRLSHFIVSAYYEEIDTGGFFLISEDTPGVEIADNWNTVGMRATASHDLILNHVLITDENFVEIRGAGGKQPN